MTELPWWIKAGIGALGGLTLAMLKLIDAQFYLASIATIQAQVAYLTYFCYMLLGSAAAVFLSDHELPLPKLRRSAFILGLLAPSVLLAIANQPFKPGAFDKDASSKAIPALSWLPISNANAQDPGVKPPVTGTTEKRISTIQKGSFEPSFGDAFSAALGRSTLTEPYVYVIGSTDDKQKALATANKLTTFLAGSDIKARGLSPQVLQVAGDTKFFVVMGGLDSKASLYELKANAASASIEALGSDRAHLQFTQSERKSLANLLADAPIVPAKTLTLPK